MQTFSAVLLIFVITCAIAVVCTRSLLVACVVFMCQSLAMALVWILLESPDLAITEAAVGAGVSSLLLFVTLKKIHAIDQAKEAEQHGQDQA